MTGLITDASGLKRNCTLQNGSLQNWFIWSILNDCVWYTLFLCVNKNSKALRSFTWGHNTQITRKKKVYQTQNVDSCFHEQSETIHWKRTSHLGIFNRNSYAKRSRSHFALRALTKDFLFIYLHVRFSLVKHAGKRVHYSADSKFGLSLDTRSRGQIRTPSVSVHKGFSVWGGPGTLLRGFLHPLCKWVDGVWNLR